MRRQRQQQVLAEIRRGMRKVAKRSEALKALFGRLKATSPKRSLKKKPAAKTQ